jgi:4'-phosphopantetheinyl transferase EntD
MIEELVPDSMHVAERCSDATGEQLYPDELAHIRNAVAKRRDEFTTVRHCARVALRSLGLDRPSMVPGRAGAPPWPEGVIGSMTHCAGYRAAAVATRTTAASIGIDAEPNEPLPDGVLRMIARPAELRNLRALGAVDQEVCWDRLLFSAKESVYKAWYPLASRWLGFEDVDVHIRSGGTFEARLLVPGPSVAGRPLTHFSGRWRAVGRLLAVVVTA